MPNLLNTGVNGPLVATSHEKEELRPEDAEHLFWFWMFERWWGHWLLALAFFGASWLVYDYITSMEQKRETGRIFWLVALFYMVAGKAGAVLVFGLPAIVLTITGIVKVLALGWALLHDDRGGDP